MQRQIDFWVTVPPAETAVAEATAAGAGAGGGARGRGGEGATGLLTATLPSTTYASILHQYVDATGHAPLLPDSVTGFWQSKMRYRTPDELLDVAQGALKSNILIVVVLNCFIYFKYIYIHLGGARGRQWSGAPHPRRDLSRGRTLFDLVLC